MKHQTCLEMMKNHFSNKMKRYWRQTNHEQSNNRKCMKQSKQPNNPQFHDTPININNFMTKKNNTSSNPGIAGIAGSWIWYGFSDDPGAWCSPRREEADLSGWFIFDFLMFHWISDLLLFLYNKYFSFFPIHFWFLISKVVWVLMFFWFFIFHETLGVFPDFCFQKTVHVWFFFIYIYIYIFDFIDFVFQ